MPRKSQRTSVKCTYFEWLLFQRDGVFYADGRSGNLNLGKHSLGTRDQSKAMTNLQQLDRHKAIELGVAEKSEEPEIGQVTIETGWEQYLAHCDRGAVLGGVAPTSLQRYSAVRDHHLDYCRPHGIASWAEFDKHALEQYAKWRGKKAAYRTLYLELTTIKTVNNWLISNELLAGNHKLIYKLVKPQGTDTYCYRPQELAAMIHHCRQQDLLHWLGNVIVALAHLGLRISELASLRWSDVDLLAKTVRIADERSSHRKQQSGTARTTKGRRSRTVPIHPRLMSLLMTLDQSQGGRVFRAARGGVLRPRNVLATFIDQVIEPLKECFPTPHGEIGFEHGRLHSFRHYFCSQAFLGGASEGEIRDWLGHADSKMVEHYRHLRNEDAQRKMEQIKFVDDDDANASSTDVA